MKAIVQRVKQASVTVDGEIIGQVNAGILLLIAFSADDGTETIKWFANKLMNLRIFNDENEKLNKSLIDIEGELLIVSNFTVYGDTRKGFRPSFTSSAGSADAEIIYNQFVDYITNNYKIKIQTGRFAAMMDVALINDGPVTLIIEK